MRLEENLAEKLARFRRVIRSRDLYDLAEMGRDVRDQIDLVRQIVCFKVYFDVVRDGRESPSPFPAGPEYVGRKVVEIIDPDDLPTLRKRKVRRCLDHGDPRGHRGQLSRPVVVVRDQVPDLGRERGPDDQRVR